MAIVKKQVVGQRGSGGDRTAAALAVAAGDALVAVCTSQDSNTNNLPVASVKFNTTENFTLEKAMGGSGGSGQPVRIEIWYLANPSDVTADVIADFATGINETTLTVYRLSGTDAAAFINGTSDGDTGNGFAPAMSITTDADNCFLIGGLCSEADITGVGTGQAIDGDYVDQSFENTVASSEAGGAAGAQAHSYNMASGAPYAQACIAIKPSAVVAAISPSAIGNPFHPGMGMMNMARFHPSLQQSTRLGIAYTQVLADSIALADSTSRSVVKTLTDTIGNAEVLAKSLVRTLSDTIGLTEVFSTIKTQFRTLTDSIGLTDSLTKNPQKGLSDTLPLTETLQKSSSRTFLDTLGLTDTVAAAATYVKSFSDSIGLTDTISRLTGKGLTDTVSFFETISFIRGYFRNFTDTITLTDTISSTKVYFRTLIDQISLTEGFTMLFNSITGEIHRLLTNQFRSVTNPKPDGSVSPGDKPVGGSSKGDKPDGV